MASHREGLWLGARGAGGSRCRRESSATWLSGPSVFQAAHFEVVAHGFMWTEEGAGGPEHTHGDTAAPHLAVTKLSPRPGGHREPASTPASHLDTPTDAATSLAQPKLFLGLGPPSALDGCPASCRGKHMGPGSLGWPEPQASRSQDRLWLLKSFVPSDFKQEEQSEGSNTGLPRSGTRCACVRVHARTDWEHVGGTCTLGTHVPCVRVCV